jgi:hypothetical protein
VGAARRRIRALIPGKVKKVDMGSKAVLWADQKTQRVFPPKCHARRKTHRCPAQHRPVPAPAGAKRPPMAGRALAGGYGPPAGAWRAWSHSEGNGLRQSSQWASKGSKPSLGRSRKRSAFCRSITASAAWFVAAILSRGQGTPLAGRALPHDKGDGLCQSAGKGPQRAQSRPMGGSENASRFSA